MSISVEVLQSLLGAESKGHWIKFMDYVDAELPFLSCPGAPKRAEIENSIIGQKGSNSWANFIDKELHWNIHSWKAWRKAFHLVKQYPYIRDLMLTASEINTIKSRNKLFPPTEEALEAIKVERQAEIAATHTQSVAALNKKITDVKTELILEKSAAAAEKSRLEHIINKMVVELTNVQYEYKQSKQQINNKISEIEKKCFRKNLICLLLAILTTLVLLVDLFMF